MTHAVARLRAERLARSVKPFIARGARVERCPTCRVFKDYCLCAWQPSVACAAGMCLIMHDTEALKPSNTGWLIADIVPQSFAFGWSRIEVDPQLIALLENPEWQPYVVFPGEYVAPERVVTEVTSATGKKPLFILLDATWTEARKMLRKSPYLDKFPVLSLSPEALSRYQLRRSKNPEHLCTAEVGALCLELAGENQAACALDAWFDAFTDHYLAGKHHRAIDPDDAVHQALKPFLDR